MGELRRWGGGEDLRWRGVSCEVGGSKDEREYSRWR